MGAGPTFKAAVSDAKFLASGIPEFFVLMVFNVSKDSFTDIPLDEEVRGPFRHEFALPLEGFQGLFRGRLFDGDGGLRECREFGPREFKTFAKMRELAHSSVSSCRCGPVWPFGRAVARGRSVRVQPRKAHEGRFQVGRFHFVFVCDFAVEFSRRTTLSFSATSVSTSSEEG